MQALIDGDIVAYQVGFKTNDEPVSFALQTVKQKLTHLLELTGADTYRLFLSSSKSYRRDFVPTYKENRKEVEKPKWLADIKQYMIDHWHAETYDLLEADDLLGLVQTHNHDLERESIICSIDKDLKMVTGNHYNWYHDKFFEVTPAEAHAFFWLQVMTGDSTDNIPGIPRIGTKKGIAYLSDYEPMDFEEAVKKAYSDRGLDTFDETVLQVRILTTPEDFDALSLSCPRPDFEGILNEEGKTKHGITATSLAGSKAGAGEVSRVRLSDSMETVREEILRKEILLDGEDTTPAEGKEAAA